MKLIDTPPLLDREMQEKYRKGQFLPHYKLDIPELFPIERIHHIEIWAGNAYQSAFYYKESFGFKETAYAGPETGVRDRASHVMEQGDVRLVLTTALGPDSPISRHHLEHGDGVAMIAYQVPDARVAFDAAVVRGGEPELEPTTYKDDDGEVVISGIKGFGDTVYRFVECHNYKGFFLPGYEQRDEVSRITPAGDLIYIDHMVTNVEDRMMDRWVEWYNKIFGFEMLAHFDDKDISTEHSALRSKVMTNPDGIVKIPINEPADGMKKMGPEVIFHHSSCRRNQSWLKWF